MWFLQRLRCGVKMESFEAKSQVDNQQQQHPDSPDSSAVDDDDKLVQLLALDLQNLVLSTKDEVIDRYIQNQLNQAVDEDVHNTFQAESANGSEEKVLEVDSNERESDESEIRCENQQIEDVDVSSEDDRESEIVEDLENERDNVGGDDGKLKGFHYPLRLDAEDCSYYMRKGMCKFGSSCRFNHPIRKKNQPAKETKKQKEEKVERHGQKECKPTKEIKKQKEEKVERHGQKECKYYTSSAGCKLGKACKFNHGRGKTVKTPVAEYNFVGLPIRPGEKECPYYMRSGSCKYGPSCRFNHPDPTAVGDGDAPTYGNDVPLPLQPASSAPHPNIPNMPSWSAPRTADPASPFVPMMYPPTQHMPPPNPDWNGYQAPAPVPAQLYPNSERALPIPPAFFLNNQPSDTSMYTHHQQPMLVSEYPERPGQPDCTHFMKTGDCKYRASCKYHHPRNRNTKALRDQRICSYFSRHGTCRYGSACRYEHPVNHNSNSNPAGEGYNNGSNRPGPQIQQSV